MIGSSKNNGENYPRKCFWTQEKETRVKFNPGLSANRPSNNWAQVSVFMLFMLVLGKSIILYSLLSLKMAGVTSMYTVTYQVPPFCTSTQALVPAHQAWTAPTISDIHWLECCTAVLSQRSGFKSQQVWIFWGAFFSQPHELWRISLDGSCILTFNCFITHSKYFKFITGYLPIVFFFQNFGLFPEWF